MNIGDYLPGLADREPVAAERREGPNGQVLYVDPVALAALAAVREASPIPGAMPLNPLGQALPEIEDLPLEFAVLAIRVDLLDARVTRLEARARISDARGDAPL